MKRKHFPSLYLPLILFALIAPWTPQIDIGISKLFYDETNRIFSQHSFFDFIYFWGVIPAMVVSTLAGFTFLLSYKLPKFFSYRKYSLFLALVCAIGPGLLINLMFKAFWGRPRPVQTFLFGGLKPFFPFYFPNFSWSNLHKSFPSGHSSMGFYFISLIVMGKRLKNNKIVRWGFALTVLLGGLLGLTRIAQGGHFFSDVLVSALFLWYVSLACDWIIFEYLAKNKLLGYYKK